MNSNITDTVNHFLTGFFIVVGILGFFTLMVMAFAPGTPIERCLNQCPHYTNSNGNVVIAKAELYSACESQCFTQPSDWDSYGGTPFYIRGNTNE